VLQVRRVNRDHQELQAQQDHKAPLDRKVSLVPQDLRDRQVQLDHRAQQVSRE